MFGDEEEEEEMVKADEKSFFHLCVCVCVDPGSVWTQAVFWQIYYSRPVLNFELCASIYRRKCFTPSHCLMSFSAQFFFRASRMETRKGIFNCLPF